VLGVQQQCHIQHTGFQRGVLHVRPQHPQEILGGGQLRVGPVDVHAAVLFVVVVGVVGIHGQHGEDAGQLDALAQHVGGVQVPGLGVIGGQGQHTAGHGVHDIVAGGLHDHVTGKIGGHGTALAQHPAEFFQLFRGGQLTEQQQVARFLKGKAAAPAAVDQVLDVVAAVEQLTVGRALDAVHILKGADVRNVGQARQHALSVLVAQTGLDAIFLIQILADLIMLCTQRLLLVKISHHVLQVVHGVLLLSPEAGRRSRCTGPRFQRHFM